MILYLHLILGQWPGWDIIRLYT